MIEPLAPPAPDPKGWRAGTGLALQAVRRWPWIDTLRTLRQRFREDQLGLTAGSLTFTTLISLVPLATVMLAVFAAFPIFASFEGALETYFLQSLVPDSIARPVLGALHQFSGKANRLGAVGLVALVFSALTLMLTIDHTLNGIWRVRTPRPIAQRVLVYWAAATLGPLVLGVSLTLTSYLVSASRGLVGAVPGGLALLLDGFEFALLAAAMAGLFHYVPNTHVRWRHAWAGGLFVAAGIEAAKAGLGWYLAQVPTYAMVYGAFATVPILLVWIYLLWVVVLLGAVVAAYAPSLHLRVVRRPDRPGLRFSLAVALLRRLAAARAAGGGGLTLEALAADMRCDPLQLEPVLDTLAAIDWVGRLDETGSAGGSARHVLLCDPSTTAAAPLLRQALVEPDGELAGFWRRSAIAQLSVRDLIDD